jgi:NAD(P)H-flavin reductase
VTAGLSRLDVGDVVGFRGPFGKGFPLEELDGRNILLIAGGMGLAALRSLVEKVLERRDRLGTVTLLVGARTANDLLYKADFEPWGKAGLSLVLTVDPGGESADWKGRVGLVPEVLDQLAPSAANSLALVCGPPLMVRFTLLELERLDFPRRRVYTTLEARMKCGVGKCGHCSIGSFAVCRDGPVVSAEVLAGLADEW